jgi:hypothetical protein
MLLASTAQATLFDRGGGLIYDSAQNLTWLSDANYANTSGYAASSGGLMDWDHAAAWADQLTFHDSVRNQDLSDWRLPSAVFPDWQNTGSELSHLRLDVGGVLNNPNLNSTANANLLMFTNVMPGYYWPGNHHSPGTTFLTINFLTGQGNQIGYSTGPNAARNYSWAVRSGDVLSPVPEPDTYVLMLAGLGIVAFVARRRRI